MPLPEALTDIIAPTVVVKISQQWEPGMSDEDVYEVARGDWWLRPQLAQKLVYLVAVAKATIRGAWTIDATEADEVDGKPRVRFRAHQAPELAHLVDTPVPDQLRRYRTPTLYLPLKSK